MKRLVPLWLVLASALWGGVLSQPGPRLVPGKNDAPWLPLFAELGSRREVTSAFTENRWFPFRKVPVVLKGVMRLAPGLGMSLGYTEPERRTVVIDSKGVLVREADGRQREFPADPNSPALSAILLPILNFNWGKVNESFTVSAVRDGDDWRLDFVPRDRQLADRLGRIVATGEGGMLRRLEFRRSALQWVEIVIGETHLGAAFTPAEKKAYFR